MGRFNASWRSRLLGWWYGCISAGFLLLTVSHALRGARPLMILLRAVIAAGFAALAYWELREKKR